MRYRMNARTKDSRQLRNEQIDAKVLKVISEAEQPPVFGRIRYEVGLDIDVVRQSIKRMSSARKIRRLDEGGWVKT